MKHVGDRTSFMKIMIHDYAEKLELPQGFVKHVGRRAYGEYQIRVWGCGGRFCWIVEVKKEGDGLFFRKGWPEFLEDYNVRFADVLVFIYEGRSKFLVKIFDPSGLKRNMASMIQMEEELVVETMNEDCVERDDEQPSMDLDDLDESPIFYVDNEGACHLEVGGEQEKEKQGNTEPTWEEGLCRVEVEGEMETEKEEHDCAEPTQKEVEGEKEQGIVEPTLKESLFRFEDEEKKSIKESTPLPPFNSSHTHFFASWSPTWQHYLTIPKETAVEKDLHSKSQLVIRDPNGNLWFMKLSTAEDGNINLSEKWSKFCEEFRLKKGDTCAFEFTSSRIVHVHISPSC